MPSGGSPALDPWNAAIAAAAAGRVRRTVPEPSKVPAASVGIVDTLWAHIHEPPPRLRDVAPELPPRLEVVLVRALAKDADERYATAGAFTTHALAALG